VRTKLLVIEPIDECRYGRLVDLRMVRRVDQDDFTRSKIAVAVDQNLVPLTSVVWDCGRRYGRTESGLASVAFSAANRCTLRRKML